MRMMARVLRPKAGAIYVDGREARRWGKSLHRVMGYVPQRAAPTGRIKVYDFVLSGRKPHMGFSPALKTTKPWRRL